MASSLPYVQVVIDENDIPGAKLPHGEVEKNTVIQLRRYLSCRNQKTTGRKAELVARTKEAITNNVQINPYVDRGRWVADKEKRSRSALLEKVHNNQKPPSFPVLWNKFPTAPIPENFCYGNIYFYLITSCCVRSESTLSSDEENNNDWGTAKPFEKGRRLINSDYVQNLQDSVTRSYYCIKATVYSSYKKHSYVVMIMLDECGNVADATCNCKGSSMSRCCHIAAVLLLLDDFHSKNKTACTSKACTWNTGGKEKDPGTVCKQYKAKIDPCQKVNFDPRTHIATKEQKKEKIEKLLLGLQMQSSVRGVPSMWELLLTPEYADYELSPERRQVLIFLVSEMKKNLQFESAYPKSITNSQSDDVNWLKFRKLLMTASVIKNFHMTKTATQFYNLVERHLYNYSVVKCANFDYGTKHEGEARQAYIAFKEAISPGSVAVEETGLWINPSYPGIGASPDGLVVDYSITDPTDQLGLLEIKCPKLLANSEPTDLSSLNEEQVKRFCCEQTNGDFLLKKHHKYYAQVQVQMGITERKWCDFAIWSKRGLHVQRVVFDNIFFQQIVDKSSLFYDNVLLPEYFEQRIPRKLPPFNLQQNV